VPYEAVHRNQSINNGINPWNNIRGAGSNDELYQSRQSITSSHHQLSHSRSVNLLLHTNKAPFDPVIRPTWDAAGQSEQVISRPVTSPLPWPHPSRLNSMWGHMSPKVRIHTNWCSLWVVDNKRISNKKSSPSGSDKCPIYMSLHSSVISYLSYTVTQKTVQMFDHFGKTDLV